MENQTKEEYDDDNKETLSERNICSRCGEIIKDNKITYCEGNCTAIYIDDLDDDDNMYTREDLCIFCEKCKESFENGLCPNCSSSSLGQE